MATRFGSMLWGVIAAVVVSAGCGHSTPEASHQSSSDENGQSPPVVVINGKDLALGSDATSSSSACKNNHEGMSRIIQWRGLTSAGPQNVYLFFPEAAPDTPGLTVVMPNGDKFNNSMDYSHVSVTGPVNGWYEFSGKVINENRSLSDRKKTYDIRGSVACANYGAPLLQAH